jgi:hypothetical protein
MSSMYGQTGMTRSTGKPVGGMATGMKDIIPKGHEVGQLQQFTPDQMNLFQSLFSHVSPDSYTSRLAGGDQSAFNEMEAPAMRQFSGLQGNIASRFSGMGSGARNSSGFQNYTNQAASDFAGDLASRRQGLQRQAIQDLMGMSHELLNERPYDRFLTQKPPSFLESILPGLSQGIGQGAGSLGIGALLKLFGLG